MSSTAAEAPDITFDDRHAYLSLRDIGGDSVRIETFRHMVEHTAGLRLGRDKRLTELYAELKRLEETGQSTLSWEEFQRLFRLGGRLLARTLRGELVVPDFHTFRENVLAICEDVRREDPVLRPGEAPTKPQNLPRLAVFHRDEDVAANAQYIPSLATVSDAWGVSICTVDGQVLSFGDHDEPFSIQSCCKPIIYSQALETYDTSNGVGGEGGKETSESRDARLKLRDELRRVGAPLSEVAELEAALGVHDFIDCEPSGDPFNAESFNGRGMPYNALVNIGAILASALVSRAEAPGTAIGRMQEVWKNLAGMPGRPDWDRLTAAGEAQTGAGNKALGHRLMQREAYPYFVDDDKKIENVWQFYFNACSLTLTADEMAVVAATLANRGVCPTTGKRVFHARTVTNCLAAMLHCGMYDSAGKFGRIIGLPAKSGVGGGILVVVPGVMGICTFSPRLDGIGNSLRGLRFLEKLLTKYALHMLELPSLSGTEKLDVRIPNLRSRYQASQEVISAASIDDVDTIIQFESDAGSAADFRELINAADYDGRTPLHLAATEGRGKVVRYLLSKGATPDPADRWGQTPLDDARRGGHRSVVKRLTEALYEQRGSRRKSGVRLAGNVSSLTGAARQTFGSEAPAVVDDAQALAVIWAAAAGDIETLRRHVARGGTLHLCDYDNRTPLHLATAEGRTDAVSFIMRQLVPGEPTVETVRFTRLSWPDRWGRTALDEAADPRTLASNDAEKARIGSALTGCARLLEDRGAVSGPDLGEVLRKRRFADRAAVAAAAN